MSTGKWREDGVPHKGWQCVGMDDLGDDRAICEMCEVTEIRYVHAMEHPEHAETLQVGCICAEHMEQDYTGPRLREQAFRSRTLRRSKWLQRQWYRSFNDAIQYLNTDHFHIAVWPERGGWSGRITDNAADRSVLAKRLYPTAEAAKLAAFDAMLALKERRP